MKMVFRIFFRDLKRLFKVPVAVFALVGALILTCLYAWYCIAANWDPYAYTCNIKIAVVNNDKGAHSELAGDLEIGKTLEETLRENNDLGWQFVSQEEALAKVESGEYYAALIIPEDFSANFASLFESQETRVRPHIDYYVNEKMSATGTKVTDTGLRTINEQINAQFTATVAQTLVTKIQEYAFKLGNGVEESAAEFHQESESAMADISGTIESLVFLNATIEDGRTSLQEDSQAYADLEAKLPESDVKDKADEETAEIRSLLIEFDSTLALVQSTLATTKSLLESTSSVIERTDSKLQIVASANVLQQVKELWGITPEAVADFMSSPVTLKNEVFYPVTNYGSGMTPFYVNLSLWVCGFVLLALLKLEVDTEGLGEVKPAEAYLARWLLYVTLGIVQALMVCGGCLYMGIQCEHPGLFILAGVVCSFVFTNIIFALASTFRHVGKALGVIFLIVQVPGSAGTYPIEMMPEFFQATNPFLPFTYGIAAMREAIAGVYGAHYLVDILVLLGFAGLFLGLGLGLRPIMSNVNLLFDRRLAETGVLINAENTNRDEGFQLSHAITKLAKDEGYGDRLQQRSQRFFRVYPIVKRVLVLFLAILPAVLLVVMGTVLTLIGNVDVETKLLLLGIWALVMVLLGVAIIVLEYINDRLNAEIEESERKRNQEKDTLLGSLETMKEMVEERVTEMREEGEKVAQEMMERSKKSRKKLGAGQQEAAQSEGDAVQSNSDISQSKESDKQAEALNKEAEANQPVVTTIKEESDSEVSLSEETECQSNSSTIQSNLGSMQADSDSAQSKESDKQAEAPNEEAETLNKEAEAPNEEAETNQPVVTILADSTTSSVEVEAVRDTATPSKAAEAGEAHE